MAVEFKNYFMTANKPLFIHCHGYDITWDLRDMKTPEKLFHPKDYKRSIIELSSIAIFIANSKYTFNKLLEIGVPENKIRLKYFGVLLPAAKTYNNKETDKNILFLGRLVDFKGPDIVIEAFNLASERGLRANLIIAGDGPLKISCELLKRRSKFSERIHLIGEVDVKTADELRKNADIFTAHNCKGLLSHQEEAFGVSIIEAMAAELPVISAKSGALEETVLNGETGILVEQFDIERHAEAFLKLANNKYLRREMGKKARERVMKYFSIELEKQRLNEIFNLHQ
jgi:glycosyltransferase involved in cell wall biosynthesis